MLKKGNISWIKICKTCCSTSLHTLFGFEVEIAICGMPASACKCVWSSNNRRVLIFISVTTSFLISDRNVMQVNVVVLKKQNLAHKSVILTSAELIFSPVSIWWLMCLSWIMPNSPLNYDASSLLCISVSVSTGKVATIMAFSKLISNFNEGKWELRRGASCCKSY